MLTTVDRDAYPIAWREAGDGPVALFLHGLGGSRTSWDDQLLALGRLRRCIAWDMPGYGASAGTVTSLEQVADAAAALLDTLGADRADVVGLSLGGMVAQHLAIRHPGRIRTLALLDTSPAFGLDGTTTAEGWLHDRLAPLDAGRSVADIADRVITAIAGPHCPAPALAQAIASMRRIPDAGLRAACHALVRHDVRELLGSIGAPTLVLVGELDEETPPTYAKHIASAVPGASLDVIPGAGHLVNAECPGPVNARLRELWTTPEAA